MKITMVSLTLFESLYDNTTDKVVNFSDWETFEKFIFELAKNKLANKEDASLYSPAIYESGSKRSNKNVAYWGSWAAVDVDDSTSLNLNNLNKDEIKEILQKLVGEYQYICHSTASSTQQSPKFRIIFRLTDKVLKDDVGHFWYALNKSLNEIGDSQTKDACRMYSVPATFSNSFNFIFSNSGKGLDAKELMKKYDFLKPSLFDRLSSMPNDYSNQLIQIRKNQLTNNTITWKSYRDCPFVNRYMLDEYRNISDTGWYRQMYIIMVKIAFNAVKAKYPITPQEIQELVIAIDNDNGQWYQNRNFLVESERAIEYAYTNC